MCIFFHSICPSFDYSCSLLFRIAVDVKIIVRNHEKSNIFLPISRCPFYWGKAGKYINALSKNAIKYNFLFFNCEKKSKPTFANMNFAKRRSWFRGSGTINYQCARQNDNDKTMEAECCFSTRVITIIGQLILVQEEEMKAWSSSWYCDLNILPL